MRTMLLRVVVSLAVLSAVLCVTESHASAGVTPVSHGTPATPAAPEPYVGIFRSLDGGERW
jgi:hypothetical protein